LVGTNIVELTIEVGNLYTVPCGNAACSQSTVSGIVSQLLAVEVI
jgi:hypothetical protein